ncbi:MAG: MFS transporter, partial [Pseudomonadota bacterium]
EICGPPIGGIIADRLGIDMTFAIGSLVLAGTGGPTRMIDDEDLSRGFSVFLASVVAAEICGPPIGGIIADRLGIDMTFAIGSLVLAGSLIAVYMLVDGRKPDVDATATGVDAEPQERLGFAQGIARLVAHPRFALLTLLYAVPAKMLLTGAVFILVPLAAVEMGATTPEIGRILMIYGIAILLTGPIFARFADRLGSFGFNIALGGLLSGLGLVLVGLYPSLVTLSIAVLMIGLGQSLSIPSQLTFTLDVTETVVRRLGPGQVLGVFRLFERIGSLLGPLIAAALLAITQASSEALLYFGLFSLITAWIASLAFLILGTRNERDALTDYFGEETRHAET